MTTGARPVLDANQGVSRLPLSTAGVLRLNRADCEESRLRIQQSFLAGAGAPATMECLRGLADRCVKEAVQHSLQEYKADGKDFAVLALGGFGRGELFPYSDLDLLFLFRDKRIEQQLQAVVAQASRALWDLGFKVSAAARTMDECKRVDHENVEFHLAMLDRRLLAGDRSVFQQLEDRLLPRLEKLSRAFLHGELRKLTEQRLAKFGNTIFHLEPNVKEAPGGLRDFHASAWIRYLACGANEPMGPEAAEHRTALKAAEFVSEVRCFLHYANGRNDNTLTYELQLAAAERSLGTADGQTGTAAEWMRLYYRNARTLQRQLQRCLSLKSSAGQTLWHKLRITGGPKNTQSNLGKPFVIRNAQLEILECTAFWDRAAIMSVLTEVAQTGVMLSRQAERELAYILSHTEMQANAEELRWGQLREIFAGDYPGAALRPMHQMGLLTEFLPEFGTIDALVIRDFYHRYTVDEHSLRAIEYLQTLANPTDARDLPFALLWKTVERRELLVLAMLLHDVGKGMEVDHHVTGSLSALETVAERLNLTAEDRAEVHFLIEHHLEMSDTMRRRDIFDAATVRAFTDSVGTRERLQRLCLLTYADIHAVNPEALTPWRAEMLWRLYLAATNHLTRSMDSDRLRASEEDSLLEPLRNLTRCDGPMEIERFLEGFPKRYLGVHSTTEIANHFSLYRQLKDKPVQMELSSTPHAFTLTLLTADRPGLFATVAGVLAGWSMNIVKAEAFANSAGIILDTFHFTDPSRTFEMNPGEIDRFQDDLESVVCRNRPLQPGLAGFEDHHLVSAPKVSCETSIRFDNGSSERCTLLEIVTQDRQGLLYRMGSVLAAFKCNIEVALIDTEGQKAIDVFYLTIGATKLTEAQGNLVREALEKALA